MRLLAGVDAPLSPQEGAGLLAAAAERGDARALEQTAVFAAAGVFRAQSWPLAIDLLRRAARAGSTLAQGQLAVLAHAPAPPAYAAPAAWDRLAAAVNVDAWLRPPEKTPRSEQPRIRTVAAFAPAAACAWLIARARARLAPARVYDERTGGAAREGARSNSEAEFGPLDTDVVLVLLQSRVSALIGPPLAQFERPSVLHYTVGQEFRPHFDFLDPGRPGFREQLARQGQRVATFLLYLSDDFDGGETDFDRAGLRWKGRAGDAIYFANVDDRGRPDPLTLHAGLAPTRGEKWLLSQFVRGAPGIEPSRAWRRGGPAA